MRPEQDWQGIFKNIAENWNWPPQVISDMTPDQLIKLSSGSPDAPTGGAISIAHPSQLDQLRKAWEAWNSEEARLVRGERLFQRHLARS